MPPRIRQIPTPLIGIDPRTVMPRQPGESTYDYRFRRSVTSYLASTATRHRTFRRARARRAWRDNRNSVSYPAHTGTDWSDAFGSVP
jgi:hypothetical protein